MCAWLEVSRSGYYAWRGTEPSARSKDDSVLIVVMKNIYGQARGNPGVRRMRAGLAALGHLVSHKRVHRLMQAAGLRGRHPRAWKRTTIGGDRPVAAPDLIGRDFTAALDMAVAARKPPAGMIFHSDRGCQYTSSVFDAYCAENNIRRSLGRTGICYDNAVSESFFATYKKELIHTRPWPTLASLEKETSDWISNYYNPVRRHSTLGYLTPEEYELGYRQLSQLAA